MAKGYMGKVLMIDLSTGKITKKTIADEIYSKYLSGLGLGACICYKHIPKNADPLGADNMFGLVTGLLTGSEYPFSGRWSIVGKSPLTGGWGDANCGGNFAPAIKQAGYDGIFFKGISKKPVYLNIDKNNNAELRDASHVWGKDAVESEEILIKQSNDDPKVVCIGQAGENLSLISGVCNDRGRIAARSGLGAVMGSKKLKAVVLAGTVTPEFHDLAKIEKISNKINQMVKVNLFPLGGNAVALMGWLMGKLPIGIALDGFLFKTLLHKWGTSFMNRMSIGMGDAPIKNWLGSTEDFTLKKTRPTDPDLFLKREKKKYYCYSCPLGCGGICRTSGKYSETHRPEYETVLALGGLCMNEDIDSILYLNEVLNRAGMDTISAGSTVAFAIECYENGLITKKDTGGFELTWGNFESIVTLIEMMINRKGIGDLFADGVKVASEKIGQGAEKYTVHSGGQELPMHDGRNDPGFALHYSVEATPGRHTMGSYMYYDMYKLWTVIDSYPSISPIHLKTSRYNTRDKAKKAAACSQLMNIINGSGLCFFGVLLGVNRLKLFDCLNAATGWTKSPEGYMEIGRNTQTLKQAFNVKHGIDPKAIKASSRAIGEPPLTEGMNKGRTVPLDKLIKDYWELFGWDRETGKPKTKTVV